ncbi:hypothetical protein PR048_024800 [Dryococelus australis]|uniref:Uncharacterized protein n=1 Tax=Dryococelus australis TaxID=614101 RepID=A0ABQ9GPL1_9NEOP|nr:hypothetical protein PR048_024800 [Dryococelus australis]
MNGRGKREIPEKTRRPTVSSGCENPVTRPRIDPGSPWWEASVLIAQPPCPVSQSNMSVRNAKRFTAMVATRNNMSYCEVPVAEQLDRRPAFRPATFPTKVTLEFSHVGNRADVAAAVNNVIREEAVPFFQQTGDAMSGSGHQKLVCGWSIPNPASRISFKIMQTVLTKHTQADNVETEDFDNYMLPDGAALECKGGSLQAGAPRGGPPASGIVQHDSHTRISGSEPAGNRARIAVVGGECASHCATTAPFFTVQHHDGNTARIARRSDEAIGVRVSVARIAPSLLDLERIATS